jgi:hypothetical protein
MIRKWWAFGIILVLIGILWSPAIAVTSNDGSLQNTQNDIGRFLRVNCYEYKPDGSIQKTTILQSKSEHLKMKIALSSASSVDEKLRVYEKYGLIPSNVTVQSMKERFDQYLNRKNITTPVVNEYVDHLKKNSDIVVVLNTNCKIYAVCQYGIHLIVGMSPITRFWNAIIYWLWFYWVYSFHLPQILPPLYLPGFDLCDFNVNAFSIVEASEGDRPDDTGNLELSWMMMFGFVGYCVEYIPLPLINYANEYIGYTAYVQAVGKPHSYE